MMDAIMDGLLDTLKLLPYLVVTFIVLELIEHKLSKKNQELLTKGNKGKVVLGGLLGALPQCGFSAVGANLFSSRVITMGTLIAVFLSTSDEMLPIMIGEHTKIKELLTIIVFKVIIGIVVGFIVDLIYKRKEDKNETIKDICEHDHCDCHHRGVLLGAIIHTLKTALFILVANLLINIVIYYVGEESLKNLLLHKNIFTYFLASLIGLIPNCAASVVITEVYLSGLITVGTLLSGLLTGSGLGILLLFKTNKNMKENLSILGIIYFVGVIVGLIVDLLV